MVIYYSTSWVKLVPDVPADIEYKKKLTKYFEVIWENVFEITLHEYLWVSYINSKYLQAKINQIKQTHPLPKNWRHKIEYQYISGINFCIIFY